MGCILVKIIKRLPKFSPRDAANHSIHNYFRFGKLHNLLKISLRLMMLQRYVSSTELKL